MKQIHSYPIGVSTCGELPTAAMFTACHEAGIAHIEISCSVDATASLNFPDILRLAEERELTIHSLHLPFSQEMDISRLDPTSRAEVVTLQADLMKRAAATGIRLFVIHPSSEPIEDGERAARMACARDSLAVLAELAESLGAVLAVEDLPRTCLGNCSEDMLELLSAHPGLRSCLDTNHLLQEDTADYIRRVGDRIVTTHVSDYDFVNERHWLPGEGKQDFHAILEALDEVGYRGLWLYELSLSTPGTIIRPRALTFADLVENAHTLFAWETPVPMGTPIPNLGMWG